MTSARRIWTAHWSSAVSLLQYMYPTEEPFLVQDSACASRRAISRHRVPPHRSTRVLRCRNLVGAAETIAVGSARILDRHIRPNGTHRYHGRRLHEFPRKCRVTRLLRSSVVNAANAASATSGCVLPQGPPTPFRNTWSGPTLPHTSLARTTNTRASSLRESAVLKPW